MPRIASSFVPRGCVALILSAGCYTSTEPGVIASGSSEETGGTSGASGDAGLHVPEGTSLYIKVMAGGTGVARARVTVHSHRFADPDNPTAELPPAPVFVADGAGNVILETLLPGTFVAQIDAPGYAPASLVLDLADGMHAGARVDLLPLGEPVVFDASLGATIERDDVRVRIPAGAVVDADNQPVTGPVQLTISPFDPSRQMSELPWPLRGERTADNGGAGVRLKTLYMADLSLWRGAEHLQLAAGATAEVEFILPDDYDGLELADIVQTGDTIPSWYFDFASGTWKEEGVGRIGPSKHQPGRLAWTTTLTHFSPHNCDIPIPPEEETCVLVTVFDDEDNPVPDVNVVLQCNLYITQGVTNADGQVCLISQAGDPVGVWVGDLDTQLSAEIDILPMNAGATCPVDLSEPASCYEVGIPYDDPKSDDCSPGSTYPCEYGGQPQEEGFGICAAGMIICDMFHQWGDACEGEVLPEDELCGTPDVDEDCDGEPDEAPLGCECSVNDPQPPCFEDEDQVQIQGQCQPGHRECGGDMKWGACIGAVGPALEQCDTPADEDCDGNPGCGHGISGWSLGDESAQRAIDVAVSNTHIYVLGRYTGQVVVGPAPPIQSGVERAFLASFTLAGGGVDVIDLGAAWPGDLNLAVNPGNEIVVAGTMHGHFDGIDGCAAYDSDGDDLAYLRFMGPNFTCAAAPTFSRAGSQRATAVDVDDVGNVFLTGVYGDQPLQLGGDNLDVTAGERDVWVARANATDDVQWAWRLPAHQAPADTRLPDLAAADDAVLVAGVFQGTRDFGVDTLYADGNSDIFVARLDAITGNIGWARDFGNTADEPGFVSVAIGPDDSFAITGEILGQVEFGLGAQHLVGQAGVSTVFVHKRTLTNDELWTTARPLAHPQSPDGGHAVAIDDANRTVLVGTASGQAAELYTGKFSASGDAYWDVIHAATGNQFGAAVAISPQANPVVVGRFDTDFTIDGAQLQLGDNGVMDAFVLILQP